MYRYMPLPSLHSVRYSRSHVLVHAFTAISRAIPYAFGRIRTVLTRYSCRTCGHLQCPYDMTGTYTICLSTAITSHQANCEVLSGHRSCSFAGTGCTCDAVVASVQPVRAGRECTGYAVCRHDCHGVQSFSEPLPACHAVWSFWTSRM
jgi:hypothetical protein